MKILNTVLVFAALTSIKTFAIDLGGLDSSFSNDGSTDGWDTQGNPVSGFEYYGGDVVVDSQGRILVAGTYEFELAGGMEEKAAQLLRYFPNGQLDASFGNNGQVIMAIPPAAIDQLSFELALDSQDGVFVGYSRLFCPTLNDAECHSDVRVYHVNTNGSQVGSQTIAFDMGSSYQRQDDVFADLIFIESLNKVVITAEVERSGADDTDFGVAVLDHNSVSGALSLDTNFDTDGKAVCYFDQQNAAGSQDSAEALVWDASNNTIIVGGSAYEGNGNNSDGWNLAFCEFDLTGNNVRQWSTQDPGIVFDSREFLTDMAFAPDQNGVKQLTVVGSLPGNGGLDFALTRYVRNVFGDMEIDTSFGPNGTGWSTVGFSYIFVGDTFDTPSEMYVESDGSILVVGSIQNPNINEPFQSATAMSMFKKGGNLDTSWGIGQSGKAVHTFNNISFWDAALGVAENPITEEIYITGFSYSGNFNMLLANFHNDRIFSNNFD